MKKLSIKGNFKVIFVLGLLSAIGPFSIDLYLPAFPEIAERLNTDVASVMLSLSSFFVGISFGQLLYGPLIERYGRKKPMYIGLVLYAISSVACLYALNVDQLIAYRFFQALGGCVGMVTSRAMVRDLFELSDIPKVFSNLMLVIALSPIIAPTVGGYLTFYFGWQSVFIFLLVLILIILLSVYLVLPESKEPDPSYSLKPKAILGKFKIVLTNQQFVVYTATSAIAYSALYAYVSGAPYVFMVVYGLNEKVFGWIFALIAAGLISASQFNNLFLRKYTSEQVIKVTLVIQSLIGIVLLVLTILGYHNLYLFVGLIFLFLACQGFNFPNASAISMAPFTKNAGSASALMGFFQLMCGAVLSALDGVFEDGTALPLVTIMALCVVAATLILYIGNVRIKKRATKALVQEEDIDMISTL
jgi:DHA1 family bicyclomycin/chloramphenicol resistance-like MFS transporter